MAKKIKTPEDFAMFAALLEEAKHLDQTHPYFAVSVEPEVEAPTPQPIPHPISTKG